MARSADIHGGNLRRLAARYSMAPADILDFSANINPLGFPDFTREEINAAMAGLRHYPDPDYTDLRMALAARHGRSPDEIAPVNGTSESLMLLPRVAGRGTCVVAAPGFSLYERAAAAAACKVVWVPLAAERGFSWDIRSLEATFAVHDPGDCLVLLGHPHNPTGLALDPARTVDMIRAWPAALFVVDEAFIDFAPEGSSLAGCRLPNLIILRSLTKILALPGLRMGYVIAPEGFIVSMRRQLPPWNVNELASRLALRAMVEGADYFTVSRTAVAALRDELVAGLAALGGLTVLPSCANFLMLRLERPVGPQLVEKLMDEDGIALRDLSRMAGLDEHYLRVAVRRTEENGRLLAALGRALPGLLRQEQGTGPGAHHEGPISARPGRGGKLPPLMLLGTGSDVGKSVLTAALCRILVQDGFKVAPFKAQNMALNSHVTAEGGEIGRAQAVQAQACRIESDVRMNPILLKPSSDHTSQLIVAGKPVGTFSYGDYLKQKKALFHHALGAFRSLADEHDLVVLEGAGGASEINLKKNDIVNMAMARAVGARVLLVGDIDRGGVFGSLVGTLETMAEWERELVHGLIINKFRGDAALLTDGLNYLVRRLGRPVLGVIPHLDHLDIPDEDSVAFKRSSPSSVRDRTVAGEGVTIAVIDTPRISNITDIDPLRREPDVTVRIVRTADDFGRPDAVILAGSKNVIADLAHLRANALAPLILAHAAQGGAVIGICGGLQMLGRAIADPLALEAPCGGGYGLSLLALDTSLQSEKILGRTRARYLRTTPPMSLAGYEIHHGVSTPFDASCRPIIVNERGEPIGYDEAASGAVWGTYLHGVFDDDLFRRHFIDGLRIAKGLAPQGRPLSVTSLDAPLDRLAAMVRAHLDMAAVYRILQRNFG